MSGIKRSAEEIILLSLSGASSACIAPFILFRVLQRDWGIAALDLAAVAAMFAVFMYVWRTRSTKMPGKVLVAFCALTLIGTIASKGAQQLMWFYPSTVAIFFLLSPVSALALATSLMLVIGVILWPDINLFVALEFYLSGLATTIFAFVFANRTRSQHQQLTLLAKSDALTGAGNRRAMEEMLHDVIYLRRRGQDSPVSMILLDLDNFKLVNDKYGHAIGDKLLCQLVEVLQSRIRKSDTVFRIGGEEFVVLVQNANVQAACELAESLRQAVETDGVMAKYQATISSGIAEFRGEESAGDWLARADQAMYRAKEGGRNQITAEFNS